MQIVETMKAHPYATGAIIIGGGALILFLMSGDDDSSNVYDGGIMLSGPSDAQVAAGVAMSNMQMEFAALREENAAQLRLAEITKGAEVETANIEANSQFNLAKIASDLQTFNIVKSAETTQFANTLQAQVAEKQIGLETLRINEASKNTQAQISATKEVALYDRTLDFETDKKAINTAKILGRKELNVTKDLGKKSIKAATKLGKKQLNVQKKLGKVNAGVQKDAATKGLVGGIIGGLFGLAKPLVSSNVTKKANNNAKTSYMPVEIKKPKKQPAKKGKKK